MNSFSRYRQKNLAVLKRQQLVTKSKRQRRKKQTKKQPKRQSKKRIQRNPSQAKMRALIKRLRLEHLK